MTQRQRCWGVVALCAAAGAACAGTLRVTVTPVLARVQAGGSAQFTAEVHDEANRLAAAGRVAWAVSGGGTVSAAGVFRATTPGTHIVTASLPGTEIVGAATVVVTREPVGPVAGVLVAPGAASLASGQSAWFLATAYDARGRVVTAPLRWRVSGGGTLSPGGLFRAQVAGTHTLTVEVVGTRLSDAATVAVGGAVVPPVPPAPPALRMVRLAVAPHRAGLRMGEAQQLAATAYDQHGRPVAAPVQWACSSGGTVSPTGLFTPRRPGAHTVTARVAGTALTATATVTVAGAVVPPLPPGPRVVRVVVAPVRVGLRVGEAQQFAAMAYDARGRAVAVAVRWVCSPGGTVSPTGVYTARAPGTHAVTAQVVGTGVSGAATVVVAGQPVPAVTRVTLTPSRASVRMGESQQFAAKAYSRRGRPVAVPLEWRCTPGGTVSATGLFTPRRPGEHSVTVRVAGTTLTDRSTVVVAPGVVARVERVVVTPAVVTLRVGETRRFAAAAYDAAGRAVAAPLAWRCHGGGAMSATGEFRAVRAGTWQVVAQAGPRGPEGTAAAVVWDPGAPRVTRVTISPPAAKSAVGKTVRFRAIAYDGRGRRVNVPVTWEALGFGEIGEITGEFQATRPGLFSIVAKVAGQSVKGSATVTVAGTPAGVAVRLAVQPAHARLAPGATAKFAVQAFDLKGKPVAVRATWTATGGRITPAGVYTAGPKPGTYAVTARDPKTGLTATVAAAIAGAAPPAKASIKVDKWDWSDRLLEIRARVTVTVRGPRLKEVKLFAIERNGDDAHLDTKPCKDGAQVYVSGKYKRGKARYVEVRLYDAAGKVVATMRREAR